MISYGQLSDCSAVNRQGHAIAVLFALVCIVPALAQSLPAGLDPQDTIFRSSCGDAGLTLQLARMLDAWLRINADAYLT